MKQLITILLSLALLSTQAQYAGMTAVNFGNTKGLVRLPANYATQPNKRFPLILHFCGNGEVGTNLSLLLNTGFGRQVALGKISGTVADSIIHVIVQSPSSGAIRLPSAINPAIDYIFKNYRVDTSADANGKYANIVLAGLSQGASDVWDINAWTGSGYGDPKYAGRFGKIFLMSIPSASAFPDAACLQRIKGGYYKFFHGDNDQQGCCALWPVQGLVVSLTNSGSKASLTIVKGGTHGNDVWDLGWSPANKDTSDNMYLQAIKDWIPSQPPAVINEYYQPAKFYYADANSFVKIELSGTAVYADPSFTQLKEYRLIDGTVCKTVITRL